MKSVGHYAAVNGSNGELTQSINRLSSQISFPSRTASSLGVLSQISEIGSEDIEPTSPDDARQGGNNGNASSYYGSGFPYGSWSDTQPISENMSNSLKRGRSGNEKMFSDIQGSQRGWIGISLSCDWMVPLHDWLFFSRRRLCLLTLSIKPMGSEMLQILNGNRRRTSIH